MDEGYILEWTGRRTYEMMKAEAGEREAWKIIVEKFGYEAVVKLRFEVDN